MRTLLMELLLLGATPWFACHSRDQPVDASSSHGDGCSFTVTEHVAEPPPPELLSLVRACEADAGQCEALCRSILIDPDMTDILDSCVVDNTPPTEHTVTIGYHLLCAD